MTSAVARSGTPVNASTAAALPWASAEELMLCESIGHVVKTVLPPAQQNSPMHLAAGILPWQFISNALLNRFESHERGFQGVVSPAILAKFTPKNIERKFIGLRDDWLSKSHLLQSTEGNPRSIAETVSGLTKFIRIQHVQSLFKILTRSSEWMQFFQSKLNGIESGEYDTAIELIFRNNSAPSASQSLQGEGGGASPAGINAALEGLFGNIGPYKAFSESLEFLPSDDMEKWCIPISVDRITSYESILHELTPLVESHDVDTVVSTAESPDALTSGLSNQSTVSGESTRYDSSSSQSTTASAQSSASTETISDIDVSQESNSCSATIGPFDNNAPQIANSQSSSAILSANSQSSSTIMSGEQSKESDPDEPGFLSPESANPATPSVLIQESGVSKESRISDVKPSLPNHVDADDADMDNDVFVSARNSPERRPDQTDAPGESTASEMDSGTEISLPEKIGNDTENSSSGGTGIIAEGSTSGDLIADSPTPSATSQVAVGDSEKPDEDSQPLQKLISGSLKSSESAHDLIINSRKRPRAPTVSPIENDETATKSKRCESEAPESTTTLSVTDTTSESENSSVEATGNDVDVVGKIPGDGVAIGDSENSCNVEVPLADSTTVIEVPQSLDDSSPALKRVRIESPSVELKLNPEGAIQPPTSMHEDATRTIDASSTTPPPGPVKSVPGDGVFQPNTLSSIVKLESEPSQAISIPANSASSSSNPVKEEEGVSSRSAIDNDDVSTTPTCSDTAVPATSAGSPCVTDSIHPASSITFHTPTSPLNRSQSPSSAVMDSSSAALASAVNLQLNDLPRLMTIWTELSKHKFGPIFADEVTDDDAPGYSETILEPMNLGLIKRRLDLAAAAASAVVNLTTTGGSASCTNIQEAQNTVGYQNATEFFRDLFLMFQNAQVYNDPSSDVFFMAQSLRRLTRELMRRFYDESERKHEGWRSARRAQASLSGQTVLYANPALSPMSLTPPATPLPRDPLHSSHHS